MIIAPRSLSGAVRSESSNSRNGSRNGSDPKSSEPATRRAEREQPFLVERVTPGGGHRRIVTIPAHA